MTPVTLADFPVIIVSAVLAVLLVAFFLWRRHGAGAGGAVPIPPTQPEAAAPVEIIAPSPNPGGDLLRLSASLSPAAEQVSHPDHLNGMADFQEAVAVLKRPGTPVAMLRQYALGENWPLACAAFVVASDHAERQALAEPTIGHLPATRPYVLLYALRFLNALDARPPTGAPAAMAISWWEHNPVLSDYFAEYFARAEELGDTPAFGGALDRDGVDPDAVAALLKRVQHPFAAALLAELETWRQTRVDRAFLETVGMLEAPAAEDSLLVMPPSWRPQLDAIVAAFREGQPRSLLISGEPRVGKSAFGRLLAMELGTLGWQVFAADGNQLMADQMYIGQLEGRVRKIVDALHARRKLVWFVRDLAQMAGSGTHSGQTASILDQILPALARGELIIVGEAGLVAAVRMFQRRPGLRSAMDVVTLKPMDEGSAAALAHEVAGRIADDTALTVPAGTVDAAVSLAQQFLGAGQLPGSVLELLKRAAVRSLTEGEDTLTAGSIIATLASVSGLPASILDTGQRIDLAAIRAFFSSRVIGQDEAVGAVVDRIAMLKAGLTDPGRPIGVLLFAGPTGTGKTELAKSTAEFLFGSAERLVRLDMSEFQAIESMAKIVGQSGGGTADSLIDRIRKQPFSVILLDEFEKAHPNCWDLFLQIFDDGRLSDADGNVADFRHCLIIMTSNLGATLHRDSGLGFVPGMANFSTDQVSAAIGNTFRPEFVNRIDRVIVFRPLSRTLMRRILDKELALIRERRGLRERRWAVEWEPSAIEFLLDRGFSPEMGARPLKRAIDQLLLAPLAATLVEHRFPEGDQFLFVRSNGRQILVEFVDPEAGPGEPAPPEDEAEAGLSLPAIVLRPVGTPEERASLTAHWRRTEAELAGAAWRESLDELQATLADPAIWQRADRSRVFSKIELTDRITEAARTAEGLFRRYEDTRDHSARAARELAGRLALQLWNLRQGMDDLDVDAPVDAILRIEPVLDAGSDVGAAGAWRATLAAMYRSWAEKRRMKLREITAGAAGGQEILLVTGFGAFRTLAAEAGLHVREEGDGGRRVVARVVVAAGPDAVEGRDAYTAAERELASAPASSTIVRRYRTGASPIVRDAVRGWRSGRLEAVLGGDFDLIGWLKAGSGN